jgi:hypothetical protein
MLSVANSAYFVACQEDLLVSVNLGMGRLPICLIDMDRDGMFDGWYKSSVSILWNEYAGHIQRDDIYPITPTAPIRLTPEELRKTKPWSYFGIRYVRGVVTFCVNGGDLCSGGPRIKLAAADQTVEYMGGLFTLRQVGLPKDKKIAFGILRDPVGMVYER